MIKRKGLAQIPLMIGLLIMAVAVPVATKLVQESQDTRNRAASVITTTPPPSGCTEGYVRCFNNVQQRCQNGSWVFQKNCPNGCSGNYCKVVTPTNIPKPPTSTPTATPVPPTPTSPPGACNAGNEGKCGPDGGCAVGKKCTFNAGGMGVPSSYSCVTATSCNSPTPTKTPYSCQGLVGSGFCRSSCLSGEIDGGMGNCASGRCCASCSASNKQNNCPCSDDRQCSSLYCSAAKKCETRPAPTATPKPPTPTKTPYSCQGLVGSGFCRSSCLSGEIDGGMGNCASGRCCASCSASNKQNNCPCSDDRQCSSLYCSAAKKCETRPAPTATPKPPTPTKTPYSCQGLVGSGFCRSSCLSGEIDGGMGNCASGRCCASCSASNKQNNCPCSDDRQCSSLYCSAAKKCETRPAPTATPKPPTPTKTPYSCQGLAGSGVCRSSCLSGEIDGAMGNCASGRCCAPKPTSTPTKVPSATPTKVPSATPTKVPSATPTGPLKCYCAVNCADDDCNWQSASGGGYNKYCTSDSCRYVPTPRQPTATPTLQCNKNTLGKCGAAGGCKLGEKCKTYDNGLSYVCRIDDDCKQLPTLIPTSTPTSVPGVCSKYPMPNGCNCSNGSGCSSGYCSEAGKCENPPSPSNKCPGAEACPNPSNKNLLQNCTPPDSDGTPKDTLCNEAGMIRPCGGKNYCCPTAGGAWTTDMTKCPAGNCTQCPGKPEAKLKGDADCSGITNINDASIWRSEFISSLLGKTVKNNWRADFDCDGKVTLNDISIWRDNFIKSL